MSLSYVRENVEETNLFFNTDKKRLSRRLYLWKQIIHFIYAAEMSCRVSPIHVRKTITILYPIIWYITSISLYNIILKCEQDTIFILWSNELRRWLIMRVIWRSREASRRRSFPSRRQITRVICRGSAHYEHSQRWDFGLVISRRSPYRVAHNTRWLAITIIIEITIPSQCNFLLNYDFNWIGKILPIISNQWSVNAHRTFLAQLTSTVTDHQNDQITPD